MANAPKRVISLYLWDRAERGALGRVSGEGVQALEARPSAG